MGNNIQYINIQDIILSNYYNENSNDNNINNLKESIKIRGITEPLLVRPKNGKYEIVLGNKRYKAALSLGLNSVPVIIKNIDDEVVKQYMFLSDYQNKQNSNTTNQDISSISEVTSNKFINTTNNNEKNINNSNKFTTPSSTITSNFINESQDVINLSELNKKEYERNDFIMNNEQINNNFNGVQSFNNNPVQEPTFGGRFFPSLEDEPTNMNMGTISNNVISEQNLNPPVNNLIDLTDTSVEKETPMTINNINPQSAPTTMMPEFNLNVPNLTSSVSSPQFNNIPRNDFINPEASFNNIPTANEVPVEHSVTNLVPPVPEINSNNVMTISNQESDFNIAPPVNPVTTQFDMSQNIAPQQFGAPQNINIPSMEPQNNFMMNSEPNVPISNQEISTTNTEFVNIPNMDPEVPQMAPIETISEPLEVPNQFPQKEVMPVVNTLKNIAKNLEEFGYKIVLSEEDMLNSYKIVIEIEK